MSVSFPPAAGVFAIRFLRFALVHFFFLAYSKVVFEIDSKLVFFSRDVSAVVSVYCLSDTSSIRSEATFSVKFVLVKDS